MIFLDSTYLIALMLKKDDWTNNAIKLEPILKYEQKMINNTVFNEVLNSLTITNSKYNLNKILDSLYDYNIDFLTENDYNKSVQLFIHYNYAINYSDCTILNTMEKYGINNIVSFDRDFDKIKGINRIYL